MIIQDYPMQDVFDKIDEKQKEVNYLQETYDDAMYDDRNHECPNCGHDL